MPRKRMIDPAIWDSVQAMGLTPAQFKLYIYLISAADDEGRMKCCPELMRSRCYPFNNYKQADFNTDLTHLAESGLVVRYAVNGVEFLMHPNWRRYQQISHPTESTIPAPEVSGNSPEDASAVKYSIDKYSIDKRRRKAPAAAIQVSDKEKRQYADAVSMTVDQYQRLVDKYGSEVVSRAVDKLSTYKMAKGKQYKSDYHAMLQWVFEAIGAKPRAGPTGKPCPQCGAAVTNTGGICTKCGWGR